MAYIEPINRIPFMFQLGEKINIKDYLPAITFYDSQKNIVATCQFSDEKVSFENKNNLFYLVHALNISESAKIPLPKMLRVEKKHNDYELTFYDNDTNEKIGRYLFTETLPSSKSDKKIFKITYNIEDKV